MIVTVKDNKLYFCTLFDSFYLSRGLAMYYSLVRVCPYFHLYIFTFDDQCHSILTKLTLENVTLIPLAEFENDRLLEVKNDRSKAEYCWTCTSSTIEFVFRRYNIPNCTYLDADLYFFDSPEVLALEIEEPLKILITEHRYSMFSKIYEEKRAGKYCVQYITFTNEENSRLVLNHWIDQCIAWCYDRYEDGKFGDQKYLDSWPELYTNVKVSQNLGAGVAPWNVSRYRIGIEDNTLYGFEKKTSKKFRIVFYHFHFVRIMENGLIDIGWNYISKDVIKHIYLPYFSELVSIEKRLLKEFSDYRLPVFKIHNVNLKTILKSCFKTSTGFNMLKIKYV